MTRVIVTMEAFGEALRELLRSLREKGETDTEYFRALLHVYGQLGRMVNLMEGMGEIDPTLAERARRAIAPESTKAASSSL